MADEIATRSYTIPQGATWRKRWQFQRREADDTLTPIDLTGTVWRMQIRRKRALDAELYLTVTSDAPTANGSQFTVSADAAGDFVDLVLADEDTETLPARTLYADIKRRWPSGQEDRVFDIEFAVSPAVTDDA